MEVGYPVLACGTLSSFLTMSFSDDRIFDDRFNLLMEAIMDVKKHVKRMISFSIGDLGQPEGSSEEVFSKQSNILTDSEGLARRPILLPVALGRSILNRLNERAGCGCILT